MPRKSKKKNVASMVRSSLAKANRLANIVGQTSSIYGHLKRGNYSQALKEGGDLLSQPRSSMPTAVSSNPISSDFHFGECYWKGTPGLLVKGSMQIYTVLKAQAYTPDLSALVDRANAIPLSAVLHPLNAGYEGNFLELISSPFSRYRFRKVTFHYRPSMANTTVPWQLTFAASSDPEHPLITNPSKTKLLDSGGFDFVDWESWDYELKNVGEDIHYTYTAGGDPADIRQACAGCFAMTTSVGFTSVSDHGMLWMSFELELYDPSPISQTTVVSRRTYEEAADEKRRRKDTVPLEHKSNVPPDSLYQLTDEVGNSRGYVVQLNPPPLPDYPAVHHTDESHFGSTSPSTKEDILARPHFSRESTQVRRQTPPPTPSQREASDPKMVRGNR